MRLFTKSSLAVARSLIFCIFFLSLALFFGVKTYASEIATESVLTPTPSPLPESAEKPPILEGSASLSQGTQSMQKQSLFVPTFSTLSFLDSETIIIPSDGTTVYSSPLQNGKQYLITISGTYIWGNCDPIHCPGQHFAQFSSRQKGLFYQCQKRKDDIELI